MSSAVNSFYYRRDTVSSLVWRENIPTTDPTRSPRLCRHSALDYVAGCQLVNVYVESIHKPRWGNAEEIDVVEKSSRTVWAIYFDKGLTLSTSHSWLTVSFRKRFDKNCLRSSFWSVSLFIKLVMDEGWPFIGLGPGGSKLMLLISGFKSEKVCGK